MAKRASVEDRIWKILWKHTRDNPVTPGRIGQMTGLSKARVLEAIDELISRGKIIGFDKRGYFAARRRTHVKETIDALIAQRDRLNRTINHLSGKVEPGQRLTPGVYIRNGHESSNRSGLIVHKKIPRGADAWYEVSHLKVSKGGVLLTGTGTMTESGILKWIEMNDALPVITIWGKDFYYSGEIAAVM